MKKTIFMLTIMFTGTLLVNASSEYYHYRWTNTWTTYNEEYCEDRAPGASERQDSPLQMWGTSPFSGNENYKAYENMNCNGSMYIINDAIETKDGILAVGYVNNNISVVLLLNKTGEVLDSFNYNDEFSSHIFLKKIVKSGDYYYAIGNIIGPKGGIAILKIQSDGTYVSSKIVAPGSYVEEGELNILTKGENFYIIHTPYDENTAYGVYNMIRTNKSFDDATVLIKNEEVVRSLTKDEKNLIKNMTVLANNNVWYNFLEEYNGGFIYTDALLDSDRDWIGNKIEYIKDGNVKWSKYYENFWIKDAIATDDNIIMLAIKDNEISIPINNNLGDSNRIPFEFYIIVLDSNGKELGKEKLSNYTEENYFFFAEHIRKVGSGFIITGVTTEYNNQAPEEDSITGQLNLYQHNSTFRGQILYFQAQYKIETKTDGNGKVEASLSKADEGASVTFTVTPKKGYQIDKIKVTDSTGKVVIFTDNTFTMPNADVTIEATFTIKNPNTKTFISTCALLSLIVLSLTGMLALRIYRRRIDKIQKTV